MPCKDLYYIVEKLKNCEVRQFIQCGESSIKRKQKGIEMRTQMAEDFIRQAESGTPFQFVEKDPLIACVGVNGGTSDYDIFRGFADAVEVLYQSVAEMDYAEDVMVYPMAFSARHCIELGLKISIRRLMDFLGMPKLKERVSIDVRRIERDLLQHDIRVLASALASLVSVDARFVPYEKDMVPYLEDYYFDEKGDRFRYAEARDNTWNLAGKNITHVGLTQLYTRFMALVRIFESLYAELDRVYSEYRTGSYTAHLSRADLGRIADRLPDRDRWDDVSFKEAKNAIKLDYSIGSREFSAAVDIIRSVPEFSIKIGMEKKFREIPEKELEDYRKIVERHSEAVKDQPHMILAADAIVEMLQKVHRDEVEYAERGKGISQETLNCLFAFYLLAHEDSYAERLQDYYDYVIGRDFDREYLLDKLEKEDFFQYVKMGMRMCGQERYLEIVSR